MYELRKYIKEIVPVGSRITCNPPPTDTDEDFLVLATDFVSLVEDLLDQGYQVCGEEDYVMPIEEHMQEDVDFFQSFRKGDTNLIVTQSERFFKDFLRATEIAKQANLLKKENRVALFQWVLYDACDLYNKIDEAFGKQTDWNSDQEFAELLKKLEEN